MFAWIGHLIGVPIWTGATISHVREVNKLFAIYSVGFFAMSLALLLLHLHAWGQRDVLELDANERHETRSSMGAWLILAITGLVATVVAIVVPPSWTGVPGWLYACLGILMPLYGMAMDRRRPIDDRTTAPTSA
jgi:hypothetical protein